jgi:NAD(P)H-hydrate epimerase
MPGLPGIIPANKTIQAWQAEDGKSWRKTSGNTCEPKAGFCNQLFYKPRAALSSINQPDTAIFTRMRVKLYFTIDIPLNLDKSNMGILPIYLHGQDGRGTFSESEAEMTRALTASQMREIDRKAIEDYKIPGLILMENAGRGAAGVVRSMITDDRPVGIFAGRGNNGGDAFVITRHLHNNRISVEVHLLGKKDSVREGGDARVNMEIVLNMGIEVRELAADSEIDALELGKYGLIVDGLLGTGLSGEVGGQYRALIEKMNASGVKVLAVDIPSGLSADEGVPLGAAVKAAATTTFGAPKLGFEAPGASEYTGKVHVIEISIPREILEG